MTEAQGTGKPGDASPGDASPGDASPGDASPGEGPRPAAPRKSTRTGTVEGQKRMVKKVSGPKKNPAVKAPVKKSRA